MNEADRNSKRRIAEDFIRREKDVEQNPDIMQHMLSTDLRDSLPPQVYALIAAVAAELKKSLEQDNEG